MNINDLKTGSVVLVNYQNGIKDVGRIESVDFARGSAQLKIHGDDEPITIDTTDKWNMIEPIPLTKRILNILGFKEDSSHVVYLLPDNGAYVKLMPIGNDIIIKNENGEWVIVLRKDEAHFGCRFEFIPFVHIFQNYISEYWGIDYSNILFDALK